MSVKRTFLFLACAGVLFAGCGNAGGKKRILPLKNGYSGR